MTGSLLYYNLFVVFCSFTPLFAFLIAQMRFLDGKEKVLDGFRVALIGTMMLIILWYPSGDIVSPSSKATPLGAVILYPLFMLLFSIVLKKRFGQDHSRTIAVSLLLGFLLTELHELPAFIQEYVNIGVPHIYPYHYLTHIATGIYFVLALKLAEVKVSTDHLILFILVFLNSLACYQLDPYLDFIHDPVSGRVGLSIYNYFKRFVWFMWITLTFYSGSEYVEKRVIDRCV